MDPTFNLLEQLLSDEALDELLASTTCLQTLKVLLQIKQNRISGGRCEKLRFANDAMYHNNVDFDIGSQILRTTLLVTSEVGTHLSKAKTYCFDKIRSVIQDENEVLYAFYLLNVVLEYHRSNNVQLNDWHHDEFLKGVLTALKGSSKPLMTFALTHLLPNYLNVVDKERKDIFLLALFNFIKENKKIELLCVLYNNFFPSDLGKNDFNLLKTDEFWLLLMDCVTSQHNYLQKQATFLLSKSTQIVLKENTDSAHFPQFLRVDQGQIEKTWRNYLILLEVSDEKQLHIVEPALCMLSSIRNLHFLWRLTLYRIFLNHSQNAVVYNVALFILLNETEWTDASKIITDLLLAVNKNEYTGLSRKIFFEIGHFCCNLSQNQFEVFLDMSLKVTWTPAAAWGLYSNIFNSGLRISLTLLMNILKKFKLIPHKYIRDACSNIILKNFTQSYVISSLDDFLKVTLVLSDFNPDMFVRFVENNREKFLPFLGQLKNKILTSVNNPESLGEIAIQPRILEIFKSELSPSTPFYTNPSEKNDSVIFSLFNFLDRTHVESYLMNRIDCLSENEDVTNLLLLSKKACAEKLLQKAFDILLEEDLFKYNKAQICVALQLLSTSAMDEKSRAVINFWKNKFIALGNENITELFVEILLKSMTTMCYKTEIEEVVAIFTNVLDCQSKATLKILENMSAILKYFDQILVDLLVSRCCDEYLNLVKSKPCKTTTGIFFPQLYQPCLLESAKFCDILLNFSSKLLKISNTANAVAYFLSQNIAHLCQLNPEKATILLPVIVDLILHGIVINKTERVEYNVCQEISLRLQISENNPNFEEMGTRLWAFDAMLILVCNGESASNLVSLLIEKYLKYFSKRYFPDSQIHFQKNRIVQALILIHKYISDDERLEIINLIMDSFLLESHQSSVKHLMQLLLICLLKNNSNYFIQSVSEKLDSVNNNRPSTITGFIPVLYHLVAIENQSQQWDRVVEILLPYSMGPQFKLRIFSQIAIIKLFEKAEKIQYSDFTNKHIFLCNSLKKVVEATDSTLYDVDTIKHEFLDYIDLKNCDCSTIFYTIPKNNSVASVEWENLHTASDQHQFQRIYFNHTVDLPDENNFLLKNQLPYNENIQKKTTPWKDNLDTLDPKEHTNSFILVTSLIEKLSNLGGLARTCEVFGIKKMVMRTAKVTSEKEFKSLSMSSENWLDVIEVKVKDLKEFILNFKKQGYNVVGAEQTSESVKLGEFRFPKLTVLVLGNEKEGIPPDLIPLFDSCVEIPQFGMVRSLNVHVAGAIVMWEYCKQFRL